MTRITHFKQQPVNIQYWDYYILCRLNTDATIALQRLEYWDGTKEDSNVHAEDVNEVLEQQDQPATQDISNWIYKAQDELQWELMGAAGEKKLPGLVRFLINDIQYLEMRNNPANTWDRKKQYGFKAKTIQDHINYLGYIVAYFNLPLRRLTPVFYAIEVLTKAGVFIDSLNADMVLAKIESFRENDKVPHFLKMELEKFFQAFQKPEIHPFRTFAEWKAQSCGMHPVKLRNGKRNSAESIPQKRGSNSIEFKTENTNIDHKQKEDTSASSDDECATPSLASDEIDLHQEEELRQALSENAESTQEGNAEVHRLTVVPEHSAEKTVNADESSDEIEAEAQERTPGLQVIETQKHTSTTAMAQTEPNIPIAPKVQQKPAEEVKAPQPPKPERPQMPPASMKWGAEKMVQITEAKRYVNKKQGAYFSEKVAEKSGKSQRDRQLEAAKKILALQFVNPQTDEVESITEDHYIRAYNARNDEWWNTEQGSLTVEDMYAKTSKKKIRILEILGKNDTKSIGVGNYAKRNTLKDQRQDVHRQAAVTVATSIPPIDTEKLEVEKQEKRRQAQENLAKLKRQQEENLAKLRGAM